MARRKRLAKGKGIKVISHWGEGEIICTYKMSVSPIDGGDAKRVRFFRIRLGPAQFIDLPRKEFDLVDEIIKFETIKRVFAEPYY